MGCDIHVVIQRQAPSGAWTEIVWQRPPYDFETRAPLPDVPLAPECFGDRNYNLFGILANVRNGSGFAGIKTGEGWPSIAADRGWPEGFDPDVVAANPLYPDEGARWMGDHSFTWVSLDELKAFDWDGTVTMLYGVVPADVYEELEPRHLAPREYCADISGPGIRTYSPDAYSAAKRTATLVERPHVRMSWPMSARTATRDWPGHVIPWLESLAKGRPLRLVIGFDS